MTQARIIVCGAGGFLGSHICQHFVQQGHVVAAVGRSPKMPTAAGSGNLAFFAQMNLPDGALSQILKDFSPDVLIYCAGTASVPQSFQAPHTDFQNSVESCAFTLETLREYPKDCHFVFLSSAALYGNSNQLPIDEFAAISPVSPYGYHKQICEILIEEYANLYGMQTAILRIFSAYGERLKRQVIHDLCQKLFDPHLEQIELYGTGQESRDFIHASDVATAIDCIIRSGVTGVYNVGSGQQTSISELAQILSRLSNRQKHYRFNQQIRSGDPVNVEADITKLKRLGFTPSVTLVEGLQKYLSWFTSEKGYS
ncbi:MAG: NAD(P)-dependent oxidoreductase [Leptolyngbyaceae cyanobacterium CRU_2_3]|nr:NAD(P)-dependent oxidoreductase [Leptolyngbyaceae cyanobacterium CRU_2_3]